MKRRAVWCTALGNEAILTTVVRSTHKTFLAAQRAVDRARRSGEDREIVSALVMSRMQSGRSYTDAVQSVCGLTYTEETVEVAS